MNTNMKLPDMAKDQIKCKMTVMNAGFYHTMENLIKRGNKIKPLWGPALMFLIEHPIHGYILYDTGYNTRYYEATRKFPYSILKLMVPARVTKEENVTVQLRNMNIDPNDVTVILSHLHIDHAAGIHDFPNSSIIISKKEWEFTRQSSLKLLKNCYLKSLFDQINPDHVKLIDFDNAKSYGPFEKAVDLFNDGTLILVPLFGHTSGQMGLIVNCSKDERYFLIADSVYTKQNYEEMVGGSRLSNVAHTDTKEYFKHFKFLHNLSIANEQLKIIPSHDPDIYDKYIKKK